MIHLILFLGLSLFCVQAGDDSIQRQKKAPFSKIKGAFSKNKKPFSKSISSENGGNNRTTADAYGANPSKSPNFPPSQTDQEFIHKMEARLPSCWENIQKFDEVASGKVSFPISGDQKKQAAEYRDFFITKYRTLFDQSKNNPLPLNNRCKKEEPILTPFISRFLEKSPIAPPNKARTAAYRKLEAELARFKKNNRLYKAPTRTQQLKMAVKNKLRQ